MELTSGIPFWPVRDGLIRTYPALDADARCDVAVIGGGISGALVAHALVEAGIDTLLIDKREIGWGSTSASTAVLQYEIDVPLVELTRMVGADHASRAYLACRGAIDTLADIAGALPADVGFLRRQSLYLATKEKDLGLFREELAARRALGLDVEWLGENDIAAEFSFRRPAALLTRHAAQVDPYAMTHALLAESVGRGLSVFDRTMAAEVRPTKTGVTIRTGDGRTITAGRVVFATGYETQEFLENHGARVVSTYAMITEPVASFDGWGRDQCVIWEHASPYLYARTTNDGRVIFGGEDASFKNARLRERLLPKKTDRLASRVREMFPRIPTRIAFAWAGTFGETEDGLAFIDEHKDWPRCYFALGYGGNGITYSVLAAEIIRDAMLGKKHEAADLFRFGR